MKYLFIGIKKALSLSLWLLCQTLIAIWHLNLKHNQPPAKFYEGGVLEDIEIGMLGWTVIFLVIAIVCCILGFGKVVPEEAEALAKAGFFIFLVLFVLSLIAGGFRRID